MKFTNENHWKIKLKKIRNENMEKENVYRFFINHFSTMISDICSIRKVLPSLIYMNRTRQRHGEILFHVPQTHQATVEFEHLIDVHWFEISFIYLLISKYHG